MSRADKLRFAVIPAAGLGTRLRPLTEHTPKELLPVGPLPAIASALLEADAAGIEQVAVVLSPHKAALRQWLARERLAPALQLHFVVQPAPLGVLDAVKRGLAVLGVPDGASYAVLYPDYIALPDQTGLAQLIERRPGPESTLFALYEVTPERAARAGRTAFAVTAPGSGPLRQILRLEARPALVPGATHTTFAEIRGPAHGAALSELIEGGADPDEGINLALLNRLAAAGTLFGLVLGGDILDLGVMPGYTDAVARFESGEARWRRAVGDS